MYAVRWIMPVIVIALAACTVPGGRSAPQRLPAVLDVSGAWTFTVESPMGTDDAQATLIQSGEQLTGTLVSSSGEMPLVGTVQGDVVRLKMSLDVRGERLHLQYDGIVAGDDMSGTVQFGPIGTGRFFGQRKAQTAAP